MTLKMADFFRIPTLKKKKKKRQWLVRHLFKTEYKPRSCRSVPWFRPAIITPFALSAHTIHRYFIRVASFKSSVFTLPKSSTFPLLPFSSGSSLALILQHEPFLLLLAAIRRTVSPTK
jgi:hypothetical protein